MLTGFNFIQQVLKNALVHDGLARGLREAAKALDKRQAHLCVLVETCTEAEYIKLIEALCAEHKINLIKVGDAKVYPSRATVRRLYSLRLFRRSWAPGRDSARSTARATRERLLAAAVSS
jgi:ribosomal protein L7Ae-like RNA K-turn-binding protein